MKNRRVKRIIAGLVVLALGVFVLLSLVTYQPTQGPFADWQAGGQFGNAGGAVGAWIGTYSLSLLGTTAYALPVLLFGAGVALMVGLSAVQTVRRFGGALLLAVALLIGLTHLVGADQGGALGYLLTTHLLGAVGVAGTRIIIAFAGAIGLYLAAGRELAAVGRYLGGLAVHAGRALAEAIPDFERRPAPAQATATTTESPADSSGQAASAPTAKEKREEKRREKKEAKARKKAEKERKKAEKERKKAEKEAAKAAAKAESEAADEARREAAEAAARAQAQQAEQEPEPEPEPAENEPDEEVAELDLEVVMHSTASTKPRKNSGKRNEPEPIDPAEYRLPDLDIISYVGGEEHGETEAQIREKGKLLQQTLKEFKVGAQVVRVSRGPVITMYELSLAPGTKVSKVESLNNDLAIALKAPNVRIVAPLPGRNTIGIEVPNTDREVVGVREMIEDTEAKHEKMAIPLFLGKDTSGKPLVQDLAACPHLLVAGATGAGKSVSINSMIGSILLTRKPSEVQLLLIDPKTVEFSDYGKLPHLICPVVTDMKKAAAVLKWACKKMDERYSVLSAVGVRNLKSYNALGEKGIRKRLDVEDDTDLDDVPMHMPHIVIIIDEFGELMMVAAKEVEAAVIRLSQKARAVGIHLICATQRPSVDVITGLIKSNLPARIAFQVASKVDSRTILDRNGAELLLGKGDMLLLPPGTSRLVRAQGSYIPDDDLHDLVRYLETQGEPQFRSDIREHTQAALDPTEHEDELYEDAVKIILDCQRGSVSLLQRRLSIGYSRAARLIDMMAEDGIVGPYRGSQARKVTMTMEEWEAAHARS
jgi:S-DNA-T family DNA segregation ATPase FtsK/SpoIIIE